MTSSCSSTESSRRDLREPDWAYDPAELEAWVRAEPTGAYARRAWFLYEWLTGRRLDLPDASGVGYVDALDPELHVVAAGLASRRHKVTDHLPGSPGWQVLPGGQAGRLWNRDQCYTRRYHQLRYGLLRVL